MATTQTLDNLREEAQLELQAIVQDHWRRDPVCNRVHSLHRTVLAEVASIAITRTIEAASVELFTRIVKPKRRQR